MPARFSACSTRSRTTTTCRTSSLPSTSPTPCSNWWRRRYLMALSIGDPAPPFNLPGTGGRKYALSDFRGAPLIVAFYPGDGTPVCTLQLSNYSHDMDRFRDVGAAVVAISPQDVDSHERFSADNGGF